MQHLFTAFTARRIISLLLLLAAAWSIVPAQGAPLEIMVEDAAEPFSNHDGTGYANDVVKAAFAAVGVEVDLKVVPYARCKAMVLGGFTAACFNMSWNRSFTRFVKFADVPLYSVTAIYYQNKAHPLAARNEAELGRGVTIGIVNGYEYPESAMQAHARGAMFESGRSEQINLKKLAAGRIDAALVMANELQGAQLWVNEAGVSSQVKPTFVSGRQGSYIGFSIQHPQGLWALEKYNHGVALIQKNGEIKKIAAKWSAER